MYIVIPLRPSITACLIKGLASAASIFRLDNFASTQISGPKWGRNRIGLMSPVRCLYSCSPVSPLARFKLRIRQRQPSDAPYADLKVKRPSARS
jgi:hypothetical protein